MNVSVVSIEKLFAQPHFCHFNLIFKYVSCGNNHTLLLTQEAFVYTVESNSLGSLGIGN